MTRPGIGLYGGLPFLDAQPVVMLDVPVIQVREVSTGHSVGYGCAWTAPRPSQVATIAAGYADGLIRALGNGATLTHEGRRLPVIGRVSMDLNYGRRDQPCRGAQTPAVDRGPSIGRLPSQGLRGTIGLRGADRAWGPL